jgi:hypothetical protein
MTRSKSKNYWQFVEDSLDGQEPIANSYNAITMPQGSSRPRMLADVLTRLLTYDAANVFNEKEQICFKLLIEGRSKNYIGKVLRKNHWQIDRLFKKVGALIKKRCDEWEEHNV